MLGRALFWRVLLCFGTCWLAVTDLARTGARAEEPVAAALHFVRLPGTEDCVDGRTLAQRVDQELGRPVFTSPGSAGIFIEAAASRNDAGYAVVLRIFDDQGKPLGSREVRSEKDDCTELSDTLALVLAVMVDPEAVLSTMATEKPAAPPPSTPVSSEAEVAEPEQPRASERRSLTEAALFARGNYGSLPNLGVGLGIAVSTLAIPYVTLRLEGTGYLDQERSLDATSGGARFRLLLAGLFACPLRADKARLGLLACAGIEAGAMQTQAFELEPNENDQTDPMVNGAARMSAHVRLFGPVVAALGANLSVPLLRTLYEVTRDDGVTAELFEPRAFAIAFDLGLSARF
jgi:hypothetical protein